MAKKNFTTHSAGYDGSLITQIQQSLKRSRQTSLITDELVAADLELKSRLGDAGIAAVVAINQSRNYHQSAGYIFVGPKKDGRCGIEVKGYLIGWWVYFSDLLLNLSN